MVNIRQGDCAKVSHISLQGEYMTPRVTNLILKYLTHAVGVNSTWKLMKPHVETLVTSFVFPLMCFSEEDQELWTDDPQEYVRRVSHLLPCI